MGLIAAAAGFFLERARGTLVSAEPEFVLTLRSSGGLQFVAGHEGRAELPPGEYRLVGWTARRRDRRGRLWEIRRAEDEPARVLSVSAGRAAPLALASPAQADLVVEQAGSGVAFHLRLEGSGRETLGSVRVNGRPLPPPSLRIADARGRTVARLAGEERCGAGCAMVWHPPRGLLQPLRAIPEADLGPFRLDPTAFRFRLEDAPSLPTPTIGQTAPDFTLPNGSGGPRIRLSSLRGRPVVVAFFCGCGDCQAAAKRLGPQAAAMGARMIAVVENDRQLQPDRIARFQQVTGFTGPVLADHGGVVTRRYQSLSCPRVWGVDRGGVIRYRSRDAHTPPAEMICGIHRTLEARRLRRAQEESGAGG